MATIHAHAGRVVAAELPPGSAAFFDREWAPLDRAGSIPAVVVAGPADQRVERAARTLAAIAAAAVAAVPNRRVAVTGAGLVAAAARRQLAAEGRLASPRDDAPAAVVETTGDPAKIVAATRRVADAGTVVLAGEPLERTYDLDLYSDVHVRGLRVVGRGPRVAVTGSQPTERLQRLAPGQLLDAAMQWHCVIGPYTA